MLSAIEIYNKPDFLYREETFAILSVNSWELLFKAKLFKQNNYKENSIYAYKPYINKDGSKSKKKKVLDRNRCGNPKSISIIEAIKRLEQESLLPSNLKDNVEALIELRDNAIHLTNLASIAKSIQELGFACIKNYVTILKKWEPRRGLSKYNLYLMPLAYVDSKVIASSSLTQEANNYIRCIKNIMNNAEPDDEYDIAIKIKLQFQKGNSFDSVGVQYDKDGVPVRLSEEEFRSRYPLTYRDVTTKARARYSDFKQDGNFNKLMKDVKQEVKLYYERRLDDNNPKSQKKGFYSGNIWSFLDQHYTKCPTK